MAIEGINALGSIRGADNQKVESENRTRRQPEAQSTRSGDSVDVTSGDLTRFATQLETIPDVRSDKIEALQKEIASGDYKVPSKALAELILQELA